MKYFIAVPSKDRVETLQKHTLSWLSKITDIPWYVFVEPQDYEKYLPIVPESRLIQLDKNNGRLAYSKEFIRVWGEKQGFNMVYKIDDDIKGWTDKRVTFKTPEENAKRFMENHAEISELFSKFETVGAVGFPYSNEFYDERYPRFIKSKRLQTCYVIKLKYLSPDPEIKFFEDLVTGMNVLMNGEKVVRYMNSGMSLGVRVGKGTGGLQSFKRTEVEVMEEIERIRKIYPPLKFKKVNKPWKIEPDIRSIML